MAETNRSLQVSQPIIGHPDVNRDISGTAMDRPITKNKWKRFPLVLGLVIALPMLVLVVWRLAPHGRAVERSNLSITSVIAGKFRDDVVARATAMPLKSVALDAVVGGRIDEVLVKDGALVKKGEILVRLSNAQLMFELLARRSDQAQQISNLSNLEVGQELGRSEALKRITQQEIEVAQAQREYTRNVRLTENGFLSQNALDVARDRLKLSRDLMAEYKRSAEIEQVTRANALKQLRRSMSEIETGLRLVASDVDALNVRAPMSGRLADFDLLVGKLVKQGDHIGRIDEPGFFKLTVPIDEFYLNRVTTGTPAYADVNGKSFTLTVSRIYPQITKGSFKLDLTFTGNQPEDIHPGQTIDIRLALGQADDALLLPNAAFANDSGGNWVFVVDETGGTATKRQIKIGRRNNRQIEVLSGLQEGDRVIVSSYALFKDAERLNITQ